tara:strand:- start:235 stop:543 length:309 start_codon:yes stop_codon:yes gene_type:complete
MEQMLRTGKERPLRNDFHIISYLEDPVQLRALSTTLEMSEVRAMKSERIEELLKDPVAVHRSMLFGKIAPIWHRDLPDFYTAEQLRSALKLREAKDHENGST